MNWWSVLENFLGNAIADLIIGGVVALFVASYIEKLSQNKNTIGALILIDGELQVNKYILEYTLNHGIIAFEKEFHRGERDEISASQSIFQDAAETLTIPINGLLNSAYNSMNSNIVLMQNEKLFGKIIHKYTVDFKQIQIAFEMKQLDWFMIDQLKIRISREIENCNSLSKEIDIEIKKMKKENILLKALRI
jgi:hypothetical protein